MNTARILIGLMASLTFACASEVEDDEASSDISQDIIGGKVESGRAAVVAIQTPTGGLCSGTLIAPKIVLTAAHCVDDPGKNKTLILFGTKTSSADDVIEVVKTHIHPSWIDAKTSLGKGVDIAILELESASTVAPAALNGTGLKSTYAGTSVTLVGFGRDDVGASGTKRAVTAKVTAVRDREFSHGKTGTSTCSGDSGGPTFSTISGKVLGVHSYGSKDADGNCINARSDTRVDRNMDFIAPYLKK